MAKLKIYAFPDLVLTQKARPIEKVESRHRKLAEDMLETMYATPGIGLAANQVGVLERIVVIDTEFDYEEYEEGMTLPEGAELYGSSIIMKKNPRVVINPEITSRSGKAMSSEGCLSVPEYTAEVQRSEKITLEYFDLNGVKQTLDAEGLLSYCIQHEMDHLDGKLFIDRLSPLKKEMVKKKLRKERAEDEARYLSGGHDGLSTPQKKW